MTTTPDEVITTAPNGSNGDLDQTYSGISELQITPEQQAALTAPIADEDVEIRPDGLVYAEQAWYRKRLCAVIGPGRWGLRRITDWSLNKQRASAEFALYINGTFISSAVGEHVTRHGLTGDTQESIKSNALMRCCKDLGMSLELWTESWRKVWIAQYAEKVNGTWQLKATDEPDKTAVEIPTTPPYKAPTGPGYKRDVFPRSETPAYRKATEGMQASDVEWDSDRLALEPDKEPTLLASNAQLKQVQYYVEKRGIEPSEVSKFIKATFGVEKSQEMAAADVPTLTQWVLGRDE